VALRFGNLCMDHKILYGTRVNKQTTNKPVIQPKFTGVPVTQSSAVTVHGARISAELENRIVCISLNCLVLIVHGHLWILS
jgi:hypothetical protein